MKHMLNILFIKKLHIKKYLFLRGNSNYVILKKLNGLRDIKLILSDYSLGATKDQLVNMYTACMDYRKDKKDNGLLNMLLIDAGAPADKAFRLTWDTYLNPKDFDKPI